jgi:hypothetical protein
LNADQVKPLPHTYGENYSINTVYHEMKKHALAFTKDQLSYDTLLQYIEAIQIPGKWSGTLVNVVLHWYVQIKAYMWLDWVGLLPMKTFRLMQSAIEDVILLEYKWQIDHGEHTDSSTYIDVCRYNVSCFGTEEHKEVYVNEMDCDMLKDMGRNISIPPKNRTQPFTSAFEEDPMWYIGESKNGDPGSTAYQHINACHHKAPLPRIL